MRIAITGKLFAWDALADHLDLRVLQWLLELLPEGAAIFFGNRSCARPHRTPMFGGAVGWRWFERRLHPRQAGG